MKDKFQNPFNITKANDFTDEDIKDYWVDFPVAGGFVELAKPTSNVPMFIIGGKGSGKTHLMRYFSFAVQKLRNPESIIEGVITEGYLGVYLRCTGLNASRFQEKGISQEKWNALFVYYMDIWLTSLFLTTTEDLLRELLNKDIEEKIVKDILEIFEEEPEVNIKTISALINCLSSLQRTIDLEVNNSAFTNKLDVRIKVTRGKLVFGVPQVFKKYFKEFKDVLFLYLIDELENLTSEQQKYINSLVREKKESCSFKIGGRTYGIKTFLTYSDQEELKDGSEYHRLQLDAELRKFESEYKQFAANLCLRRLNMNLGKDPKSDQDAIEDLQSYFELDKRSPVLIDQTKYIFKKYDKKERPYFASLKKKLNDALKSGSQNALKSSEEIDYICEKLKVEKYPILEKFNIFLFYQDWYQKKDLVKSADDINQACVDFIKGATTESKYKESFDARRLDLYAQLLRTTDQKQNYYGIDSFIAMSDGIPRHLLVIFKKIFEWSIFKNEDPFGSGKISFSAQNNGIKEASEWFYNDHMPPGQEGVILRDGIQRLGRLFRNHRYSDKPPDVGMASFSTDLSEVTSEARRIIEIAEKWSLLIIADGGQKTKNNKGVDSKYHFNKMLSPRWDLSLSRRSAIKLGSKEINSIFDKSYFDEFSEVLQVKNSSWNAPFLITKEVTETSQTNIPGV